MPSSLFLSFDDKLNPILIAAKAGPFINSSKELHGDTFTNGRGTAVSLDFSQEVDD